MKLKLFLLVLLGMALNGQLLAPMLMTGCTDMSSAMQADNGHAMHMHVVANTPHAFVSSQRESGSDCCHSGHTEQCPMTGCLAAALPGLIVIEGPHHRVVAFSAYLPLPHEQHVSAHYRPPIFA